MILLIGFLIYWYLRGDAPDASTYLVIGAWLAAVMALTYGTNALWTRYVGGRGAAWLLFPGALLHRLAHAAAALALGCSITHLRLYSPHRDEVGYTPPPGRQAGVFALAAAPILAALAAIGACHQRLGGPMDYARGGEIKVRMSASGARAYAANAWSQTKETWRRVWTGSDFRDWRTWAFFYLLLAFTVTSAPTRAELPAALIGVGVAAVALFALDRWAQPALMRSGAWQDAVRFLWKALVLAVMASEAGFACACAAAGLQRLRRRSAST